MRKHVTQEQESLIAEFVAMLRCGAHPTLTEIRALFPEERDALMRAKEFVDAENALMQAFAFYDMQTFKHSLKERASSIVTAETWAKINPEPASKAS